MENNISSNRAVFKDYNQDQLMLIPPSLEELITPNHPVRLVNDIIDRIDLSSLMRSYEGGGSSSYHPRMLLKVLVYGYLTNTYSSRKLEAAVKENIHFMWLAGMNRPDHHTINRFRSERLKKSIKKIFSRVVMLLAESGVVSLKEVYTDGTKLEAYANKYSFVWGKSIAYNKARISKQLEELWRYTQTLACQEMGQQVPDFTQLDPDQVERTINQINEALKEKPVKKKIRQKLIYAKKHWPGKLKDYQEKENILGQRNSYSKTDHDATFMRLKEDVMKNGQLKPAYNIQLSTSQQYILQYSVHQKPSDTTTLPAHLEGFKSQYGKMPESITADAGYGSQENYAFFERHQITGYVKYNYFHKEQRESKKKPEALLDPNTLYYNPEQDAYICPMGQVMAHVRTDTEKSETGFQRIRKHYQAENCRDCPLKAKCKPKHENAILRVNHDLMKYKNQAKALLLSEEGVKKRKQRPADVEAVFGQLKENKNFRRFRLRGLEKVGIEMGLVSIAHNIAKLAA
jgi:transposase